MRVGPHTFIRTCQTSVYGGLSRHAVESSVRAGPLHLIGLKGYANAGPGWFRRPNGRLNGAKVLAVDADLRRPAMHTHFGIQKTPGLSDLIVGKCQASQAIQITRLKGLQVLPCGYVPPNPAELLGSASMRQLVEALRSHYDWVLIDTPPVLAMADTAVLCPLVEGVILIIAAEASRRPAVQRAIDQIAGIGGKVVGVVLNRVNLERNSYYYGQYYGEYYRSYYGEGAAKKARDAEAALEGPPLRDVRPGPRPVRRPR